MPSGRRVLIAIFGVVAMLVTAGLGVPFWDVTRSKWTNSTDLRVGDQLRQPSGSLVTVTALGRYSLDNKQVFNLTVADVHTYYAGAEPVLVHNSGPNSSTETRDAIITGLATQELVALHGELVRLWTSFGYAVHHNTLNRLSNIDTLEVNDFGVELQSTATEPIRLGGSTPRVDDNLG